jgi:hypothetical protein
MCMQAGLARNRRRSVERVAEHAYSTQVSAAVQPPTATAHAGQAAPIVG